MAENLETNDSPQPSRNRWKAFLWGAVFLVLAVSCGVNLSNGGGSSRDTGGYDAQVACKDAVKERLKAPATAKFTNVNHVSAGEEAWTVTGDVDSENSFGANLRTSWKCEIHVDGNQWKYSVTTN